MYKEYPINPITDLWEKLDHISIELLISQTLEHHKPQEERDKELAQDLYNKLKEEKDLTSNLAINGKVISAKDFMMFKHDSIPE